MRLRKSWFRRALLGALALLVLFVMAVLLFPQQVLSLDSGEVQADALVLLGGGRGERPARAAELFHSGAAPTIIVSGGGDAEQNKRLLVSKGVPAAAVEIEPKSTSTRQNAELCLSRSHPGIVLLHENSAPKDALQVSKG